MKKKGGQGGKTGKKNTPGWRSPEMLPPRPVSPQGCTHKKSASELSAKIQSICKLYSKKLKGGQKPNTLGESAAQFSLAGTEDARKLAEGGSISNRGSVDYRSKEWSPSNLVNSGKAPLSFNRLYRGIRFASSGANSPAKLDSGKPEQSMQWNGSKTKILPLRIAKKGKGNNVLSSLAMRYPSPKIHINSFEASAERQRSGGESEKRTGQGKRVHLKKVSEVPKGKALPKSDLLRSLLNSSKQKVRSSSQKVDPSSRKNSMEEAKEIVPMLGSHKPIIQQFKEKHSLSPSPSPPLLNKLFSQREMMQKCKRVPRVDTLTRVTSEATLSSPPPLNKIDLARMNLAEFIKEYRKKHGKLPESSTEFYTIGRVVGKGAFGKVNLCIHKLSKKLVAIKSLHKHYLKSDHNNSKLQNEISILKMLKHKNVMRIYETFYTDSYVLIVLELCSGGDLLTYVRKRRKLAEPVAKITFRKIVDGISYCHSKGVVHRDIKLDNVLLNSEGELKLGDFGVSKKVFKGQRLKERCGTPAYIAPEILKEEGYDGMRVDIWSAGVVLYAMLYGNFPFRGANVEELESLIVSGGYSLSNEVSEEARDLIARMLCLDPSTRITIPEILKHSWMADTDFSLSLFSEDEKVAIRKEFDYNERIRERGREEGETSIFTTYDLDVTGANDNGVDITKSSILAPFNSNEPDERSFIESVTPLLVPKKSVIFCSKLREFDRQYERNNNSQIDNGVYVHAMCGNKEGKLASPFLTKSTAGASLSSSSTGSGVDYRVISMMEKMGFEQKEVLSEISANEHNCATTCYYLLSEP